MFWWGFGPGWGWVAGLISATVWIAIIVAAIVLLRRELPDFHSRYSRPPALRTLEERYAKGEITREDFLHRREVLLNPHLWSHQQQPSPPPPPAGSPPPPPEPTQPIPPQEPPG
jgi:hypothetical protein